MSATRTPVLVISASIGGGHVAAARALEAAFRGRGVDVLHADLLDYTSAPFRRLYRQTYFDLVRTAPDLVDWLGKRLDQTPSERKGHPQQVRARLGRLISFHLPRLIDRHRPEVVVHTHFLPPEILSSRVLPRRRRGLPPQAVVVTDFAAHSLWLQPGVWGYFVACEEVRVHLASSGVAPERLHVTGIPIDPRFGSLPAKREARAALRLPPEGDVLLLMASGMERRTVLTLIEQLADLKWPLTAVVVCGRSRELLGAVQSAAADATEADPDARGLVRFEVVGFSSELPALMAAADLIAGKPGGLTTSEALAARLPFAVVQPYPLQEEANANYLLEHGAALRIDPLTTFNHKLKAFFGDPGRRREMSEAAGRLARPAAAAAVTDTLCERLLRC